MSHLQYINYDGWGQKAKRDFYYSQVIRIGDRIECASQGGWDPQSFVIHREINAQIDQAFANMDLSLRHAGGKGWEQVFRVNSYHVPINDEGPEGEGTEFQEMDAEPPAYLDMCRGNQARRG